MNNRPAVQPPKPWRIPKPYQYAADSGTDFLVFQRDGQHIASVAFVLNVPLTLEPQDIEGVASLVFSLIDQGSKLYPPIVGLERLEKLGATLSGTVGYSATTLELEVPVSNLKDAQKIVTDGIIQPLLLAEDIERHKRLRISEIEQAMARSSTRASLALRQALIQPQYRASRLRPGDTDKVEQITGDDVRHFFASYYCPSGSTVIMSGDFCSDPIQDTLEDFLNWHGAPTKTPVHETPQPLPPTAWIVDRPGSVQADVHLGVFGIDNQDREIANLWAACYAMGGAFLSRLNKVLREEKGFTYGAHMGNSPMRSGGLLSASASFRNDVAIDGIQLMADIIDIADRPFLASEIKDAINYASGSNPGHYQTAQQLTSSMASLVSLGLGYEFVNDFNEALHLVTPDAATETYARLVHDPTLIVVGDAKTLTQPLCDAGWPVEVISR